MSTVGIDFGNETSKIAVVRRGGVDVIVNEVSRRETPTIVAFSGNQRFIGESGWTQFLRNLSGTVNNIKRLIGRKYSEVEVQEELKNLSFKTCALENDQIGIQVNYDGKLHTFTTEQILAMYLKWLNRSVERENQSSIAECVISCPVYYTDSQRHALINAATIAGFRPSRILSEVAALGLQYGFYKTDLPEKEPLYVMFIDVGHCSTTASVIAFTKDKLKVLSSAYEKDFGGRSFDRLLANYFEQEFKKKYGIDVSTNNRAKNRLFVECDKVKKTLSANPDSPISIECLMNDIDAKGMISRGDLEEKSSSLVQQFTQLVDRAITESGINKEQITAIELVGGASRIPMLQQAIRASTGIEPSHTMNKSESVARGCALQAAILSTKVKAREFVVQDCLIYPIEVSWNDTNQVPWSNPEDTMTAFEKGTIYPNTRLLSLTRKNNFELNVRYLNDANLCSGSDFNIGKYTIGVNGNEETKFAIKIKIDGDGIFSVETVQKVETVEVEEPATPTATPTTPATPPTTSEEQPKEEQKEEPTKKKRKIKRTDLNFTREIVGNLNRETIDKYIKLESTFSSQDLLIQQTAEAKNLVESYVYDTRSKLNGAWEPFATGDEKSNLLSKLEEAENWLYGDGEETTKDKYEEKLNSLKILGDVIFIRFRENEMRSRAIDSLRSTINKCLVEAQSTDPKYEHIDQNERTKINDKCLETLKWLENIISQQDSLPKHSNPVLTVVKLEQQQKELDVFSRTILNKPKPTPKPTPTATPKQEEPPKQENQQQQQQNQQQQQEQTQQQSSEKEQMDID